jgi:serine/threonine protein kinase
VVRLTYALPTQNKGAKDFIKSLPQRATSVTMEELCPKFSHEKDVEDLLLRMLCIDPRRRISVKEALEHPFFADYYDPQSPDVQDAGTSITLENVMIPEDDVEKAWEDQYPYCIRVGWEHDRAKAVWWRHFYQRDSSLPVEYPGRAEFKADMVKQ